MTTATLGDMFPELETCRPTKKKNKPKPVRKGTAQLLKEFYPEMEFMDPVLITRLWLHFQEAHGIASSDPSSRDERFPTHVVSHIQNRMKEAGLWK